MLKNLRKKVSKGVRRGLAGILLAAGVLGNSISSNAEEVYKRTHTVELGDDMRHSQGEIDVDVSVDHNLEKKEITLDIKTEGFDRRDWTAQKLFSRFNGVRDVTGVYLIHPKGIQIGRPSVRDYFVPSHKFVDLVPYSENPDAQWLIEKGQIMVEKGGKKLHIPMEEMIKVCGFLKDYGDKTKFEQLRALQENSVVTEIPRFNLRGGNTRIKPLYAIETAKEISTARTFTIPYQGTGGEIVLWTRITVGDINKSGQLEDIVVPINLNVPNANNLFFTPEEIPQGYEPLKLTDRSNQFLFHKQLGGDLGSEEGDVRAYENKRDGWVIMRSYHITPSEEKLRLIFEDIAKGGTGPLLQFSRLRGSNDLIVDIIADIENESDVAMTRNLSVLYESLRNNSHRLDTEILLMGDLFKEYSGEDVEKVEPLRPAEPIKLRNTFQVRRTFKIPNGSQPRIIENGGLKQYEINIDGTIVPGDGVPEIEVYSPGRLEYSLVKGRGSTTERRTLEGGEFIIFADDDFRRQFEVDYVSHEGKNEDVELDREGKFRGRFEGGREYIIMGCNGDLTLCIRPKDQKTGFLLGFDLPK